jgi:hypothetical protein
MYCPSNSRESQPRPAAGKAARKPLCIAIATTKAPPSGGHVAAIPPGGPAPATREAARKLFYCRCHEQRSRGPVTATCAAAVPGGSMFCACHATARRSYACSFIYCSFHEKDVGIAP